MCGECEKIATPSSPFTRYVYWATLITSRFLQPAKIWKISIQNWIKCARMHTLWKLLMHAHTDWNAYCLRTPKFPNFRTFYTYVHPLVPALPYSAEINGISSTTTAATAGFQRVFGCYIIDGPHGTFPGQNKNFITFRNTCATACTGI